MNHVSFQNFHYEAVGGPLLNTLIPHVHTIHLDGPQMVSSLLVFTRVSWWWTSVPAPPLGSEPEPGTVDVPMHRRNQATGSVEAGS